MIIKSSTNLCENYDAFSELAHSIEEPIFVTKDGEGDLVLMSIELYEKQVLAKRDDIEQTVQINSNNTEKGTTNMTEYQLGKILKKMYNDASRGVQVAYIHVFSIYYANKIEKDRLNKKEILKAADLPESYQTEISKGINLAKYVSVKDDFAQYISKIQASFE